MFTNAPPSGRDLSTPVCLILSTLQFKSAIMPAYYTDETFDAHTFPEDLSSSEFEGCTFNNCHFSNANLSGCKFEDCSFSHCDFSNARLTKAVFQEVEMEGCKLLGLDFQLCNPFGFSIRFQACQLDHSNFLGMKLRRCSFDGCQLNGVDFAEADAEKVSFRESHLRDTLFERTNLQQADFRGASHLRIDPVENRLKGARFSKDSVMGLLERFGVKVEG